MSLTITSDALRAVLTGTVVGGKGYGISHSWDGSVLTVRSDSGISSADLLGPAGQDARWMLVTVSQQSDGSYTADKTFAEIVAAADSGTLPVVRLEGANGSSYGQLVSRSETMVQFGAWNHGGVFDGSTVITIDNDNVAYLSYPEELPVVGVAAKKEGSTVTVTVSYADLSKDTVTIGLNDDGDPVSVTRGGVTCSLSWEGFDE